jgi:hypothetical protein
MELSGQLRAAGNGGTGNMEKSKRYAATVTLAPGLTAQIDMVRTGDGQRVNGSVKLLDGGQAAGVGGFSAAYENGGFTHIGDWNRPRSAPAFRVSISGSSVDGGQAVATELRIERDGALYANSVRVRRKMQAGGGAAPQDGAAPGEGEAGEGEAGDQEQPTVGLLGQLKARAVKVKNWAQENPGEAVATGVGLLIGYKALK